MGAVLIIFGTTFMLFVLFAIVFIRWWIWHFTPLIRARHDYYRQNRMHYDYPAYVEQVQRERAAGARAERRRLAKARRDTPEAEDVPPGPPRIDPSATFMRLVKSGQMPC